MFFKTLLKTYLLKKSLPEGWVEKSSKSHVGRVFYYNTVTQESVWERPTASASGGGGSGGGGGGANTVRASHLLVKHKGSRNPSSWKEKQVTRSKEEATKMVEDFRRRILDGEISFEDLAKKESHCNSASKGGDLGVFGRGDMQKEFEEVAFKLKVGYVNKTKPFTNIFKPTHPLIHNPFSKSISIFLEKSVTLYKLSQEHILLKELNKKKSVTHQY